jgi:hypothetical protein
LKEEPNDASQIVDLSAGYAMPARGEPLWREIAGAAMAPDMVSFLKGGVGSRSGCRCRTSKTATAPEDEEGQLIYVRNQVKLAPVPRPTTLHDSPL